LRRLPIRDRVTLAAAVTFALGLTILTLVVALLLAARLEPANCRNRHQGLPGLHRSRIVPRRSSREIGSRLCCLICRLARLMADDNFIACRAAW